MRARDQYPHEQWRWLPLVEASGVFLLIIGYIWWGRFYFRPGWLVPLALVIGSHVHRKETPATLDFSRTNLVRCFREFGPPLLGLAIVVLTVGTLFNTTRSITLYRAFWILALYCVWGLFQQYVLNGYFVNRFAASARSSGSNWVPVLAATFFAGAHLPNPFLVPVTCVTGYLCARVYLKYRNLYFLGIAHGLVGTLLYLVVPDSVSYKFRVGPLMAAQPCSVAYALQPRIGGATGGRVTGTRALSNGPGSAPCAAAHQPGVVGPGSGQGRKSQAPRSILPALPPRPGRPARESPPPP